MVGIQGAKVQVFHSNKLFIFLARNEMKSDILEIILRHPEWMTKSKNQRQVKYETHEYLENSELYLLWTF